VILAMVNEAARALEEGVVQDAQTLDMAMILGAGFPPFRGGLLKYADEIGLEEIVDRLLELAEQFGDRFIPAQIFEQLIQDKKDFYSYKK
jgi:3-hydroxyacyl-CoA dehydrogenase/enoyl-CoA hydratase/3-hydroxybutyryl-CoA epimerase